MSSSRRRSGSRSGKAAKQPASRTGGARSVLRARGEVASTAKRPGRTGAKPQRKPAAKAKAAIPARGKVASSAKRSGQVGVTPPRKPAAKAKAAVPTRRDVDPMAQRRGPVVDQAGGRNAPPPPKPKSSIRLGGSSRLTIKPGPPGALRPTLTLSTKERPGGPRPLSDVELDEDEVLIDGFDAILDGVAVRITAVLERTCVYIDSSGDRRLASKKDLVVEADKLPIRRRGLG